MIHRIKNVYPLMHKLLLLTEKRQQKKNSAGDEVAHIGKYTTHVYDVLHPYRTVSLSKLSSVIPVQRFVFFLTILSGVLNFLSR